MFLGIQTLPENRPHPPYHSPNAQEAWLDPQGVYRYIYIERDHTNTLQNNICVGYTYLYSHVQQYSYLPIYLRIFRWCDRLRHVTIVDIGHYTTTYLSRDYCSITHLSTSSIYRFTIFYQIQIYLCIYLQTSMDISLTSLGQEIAATAWLTCLWGSLR